MPDTFQLKLLTPYKSLFEGPVTIISLPGESGEFGVMAGHTKYTTTLQPGIVRFEAGGGAQIFAVGGGFAEVTAEGVVVLADSAESPRSIDRQRAEESLSRSERELAEADPADPVRLGRLRSRMVRARNRIKLLDSL